MSLILDALNRADQERNDPNQNVAVDAAQSRAATSGRPVKRWALELTVLVAAIAATYFISQNNSNTPLKTSEDKKLTEQPAIQEPFLPAQQAKPTAQYAKQPNRSLDQTSTPVTTEQPPKLNAATQPKPELNPAISSLYQQQAQSAKKSKQPQTANTEQKKPVVAPASPPKPAAPAQQQADIAQSMFEQIPLLVQLPTRIKRNIPSIDYSVHVYSDAKAGGFVTLNGKRCRTGDEVAPGLVVIKILKNSAVLDFKGTKFRLMSLSSWANF